MFYKGISDIGRQNPLDSALGQGTSGRSPCSEFVTGLLRIDENRQAALMRSRLKAKRPGGNAHDSWMTFVTPPAWWIALVRQKRPRD